MPIKFQLCLFFLTIWIVLDQYNKNGTFTLKINKHTTKPSPVENLILLILNV
jgi:hypothetical protein